MRIIPHRVPPSARAASHSDLGAWLNTSRTTEVMIGNTMNDTTTPALSIELVNSPVDVRKKGMKSRYVAIQETKPSISGTRNCRPQMP